MVFPNNFIKMLLEDQILPICGNNLLVAKSGNELLVVRCRGCELDVVILYKTFKLFNF